MEKEPKTKDGKFLPVFLIQTALGFTPQNYPKHILNRLVSAAPIKYCYLDSKFLYHLEKMGIPATSKLPFAASWLAIVEKVRKENPHISTWLATLLYAEWGFMYWFNHTAQIGLPNDLAQKSRVIEAMAQQYPDARIASVGTSSRDLEIKWWLDDLVFKIRAAWDKLPYAISETNVPRIDLKGNRQNSRIRELVKNKALLDLWPGGAAVFDNLVDEMKNIDYIKKHRDAELHRHVKPYAEVFGLYGKHESLTAVWERLGLELNRCREAVMATIGLILRKRKG